MAGKRDSALKTQKNAASVADFLNNVENARRRDDARTVVKLMRRITGNRPTIWSSSIIGFGSYDYAYASGRSGR